ncbi:Hypothetical Protein FCC1311_056552 [Hondaea fermentalgiana]|uniref:Uncharacterized protein n=1 Tax=Hondaea fermentalgiana TaxID=2315210 RepID=A0A2R5GNI5_9STRA|nr:Hypothetical Protein FCC1311_056552 [Hondaea fermentalgiana]|eukprot:GBG29434.1 Hypothetical Protein FCC1311_056552 [Hondaea fermentalgiana]
MRSANARGQQAFAMPPTVRKIGGAAKASNGDGQQRPGRLLVSEVDRQGWVVPLAVADDELPDWDSFDTGPSRAQRPLRTAGPRSVASSPSGVTISASGFQGLAGTAEADGSLKTKARIHRSGSVDILIPGAGGEPSPSHASLASPSRFSLRQGYRTEPLETENTGDLNAVAAPSGLVQVTESKDTGSAAVSKQRPAPRQLQLDVAPAEPRNGAASLADEVSFWELRRRRDVGDDENDGEALFSSNAQVRGRKQNSDAATISQKSRAALGITWLRHEFEVCSAKLFGNGETASPAVPRMRQLPPDLKSEKGLYGLWCLLDETVHAWIQRERHLRNINKEGAEMSQRALRQAHEVRRAEKVNLQMDFVKKMEEAKNKADEARALDKEQFESRIKELEDRRRALELKCIELSTEKKQRDAALVQLREQEQRSRTAEEANRKRIEADLQRALEKAETQLATLQKENASLRASREAEVTSSSQRERALEAELLRIRDELGIDHSEEIAELKKQHAQRYREIEHKMQQLMAEHDSFVRQLQAEHDDKTAAVRKEHNMQLEMARRATSNAEKSALELKENHKEQLRRLHVHQRAKEAAYEKDLQRIRRQASRKDRTWVLPPPALQATKRSSISSFIRACGFGTNANSGINDDRNDSVPARIAASFSAPEPSTTRSILHGALG